MTILGRGLNLVALFHAAKVKQIKAFFIKYFQIIINNLTSLKKEENDYLFIS